MISKVSILLCLLVDVFILNDASLPINGIDGLPRGQYIDKLNGQPLGSRNTQWDSEVSEVLHLLGVDSEPVVKPPIVNKRANVKRNEVPLGLHEKSGFKWQYTVIATVCSIFAVSGIVVAAACYYKMHKALKSGNLAGSRSNSSNNGSGIVPLGGSNSGDKKLAQSAQMYHYQHQKQQMIALEKADNNSRNEASDDDSEPDDAVDDFTVYECPGMAMGGELEVKNPLFQADPPSPTGINGDN